MIPTIAKELQKEPEDLDETAAQWILVRLLRRSLQSLRWFRYACRDSVKYKVKSAYKSSGPFRPELISVSVEWSEQQYFYSPWMECKATPQHQINGYPLSCPRTQHNVPDQGSSLTIIWKPTSLEENLLLLRKTLNANEFTKLDKSKEMINTTVVLVTKDNFSVYALVLHSIETASDTQESVLSHFQTPNILRRESYFQLPL